MWVAKQGMRLERAHASMYVRRHGAATEFSLINMMEYLLVPVPNETAKGRTAIWRRIGWNLGMQSLAHCMSNLLAAS